MSEDDKTENSSLNKLNFQWYWLFGGLFVVLKEKYNQICIKIVQILQMQYSI